MCVLLVEITTLSCCCQQVDFAILSSGGRRDLSGGQRVVGLQRRLISCYSSECFALHVLFLFDHWNFTSEVILYNYVFVHRSRELSSILSNQKKYETSIAQTELLETPILGTTEPVPHRREYSLVSVQGKQQLLTIFYPVQDETLRNAVAVYNGKSWKKIGSSIFSYALS